MGALQQFYLILLTYLLTSVTWCVTKLMAISAPVLSHKLYRKHLTIETKTKRQGDY